MEGHTANSDRPNVGLGKEVPAGSLRRPTTNEEAINSLVSKTNELTLSRPNNGQTNLHQTPNKLQESDQKKSALSPFAMEFKPRTPPVSIEPAYRGNNFHNAAWSGPPSAPQSRYDSSEGSSEIEADDYLALNELKEVIDTISSEPASYENLVGHITDVLNNFIEEDDDIILQCAVNTIVDQAIIDQNFRYNGVRMCVHLIENLKIGSSKGSFKDILLQRCQREFSRRESLAIATDGGSYLRGVSLFIGDLSTRCPDSDLVQSLPDLLNTLLNRPMTENVRCACQVLKLCGPYLEEHYRNLGTPIFEKIFDRLSKLLNENPSSQVVNIVENVLELRERGWKPPPLPANFYNPYAGRTPEELMQNNSVWPQNNPGANFTGNYDFGPCGDEQDTDVCDAFEEFLRNSGQMN